MKTETNTRTIARLHAVQTLYEMDISGNNATQCLRDIAQRCDMEEMKGIYQKNTDHSFLEKTVRGVVTHQKELDNAIHTLCTLGGRVLPNLDILLRALLRAAAWEITHMDSIPHNVSINEYLNIAHQFFDGGETRFINGILDALAKQETEKTIHNTQ